MIQQIINKLRNIIAKSRLVSDQIDDNYSYSVNIITYGQTTNAEVWYPYGMASRAPENAVGVTFQIAGHPENQTTFPYDPSTRFTGLAVGESIFGNQTLGTYIYFRNDGIDEVKGDLFVDGDATIDKNLVINGDATFNQNVLIKGNLIVEGTINATGNISTDGALSDADGDLSEIRTVYNSRNHPSPAGGNTGSTNQPMT